MASYLLTCLRSVLDRNVFVYIFEVDKWSLYRTPAREMFSEYSLGFTRIEKKWLVEKSDVFSTVALYDQCFQGKINCKIVIAKLKPFQELYTTCPGGTVVTSSAPTNVSRVWYPTSAYVMVIKSDRLVYSGRKTTRSTWTLVLKWKKGTYVCSCLLNGLEQFKLYVVAVHTGIWFLILVKTYLYRSTVWTEINIMHLQAP